jgi:cyanophycinase
MRRLFLYGGQADNFAETSRPFIEAAGGPGARIALLFPTGAPGWDRNLAWYRDPWLRLGATVIPLHPQGDQTDLDDEALGTLARATGIFICGGETRRYHRVYVEGRARVVLRAAYLSGIPYAGLSAGALIAPTTALIWGDRLNGQLLRGSEEGCDADLQIGPGLGLLPDLLVETHFSERGGLQRLEAALALTDASKGLGIDDPACVLIENETHLQTFGRGSAYLVHRTGEVQRLTPTEQSAGGLPSPRT